jgi:hypothetical protein
MYLSKDSMDLGYHQAIINISQDIWIENNIGK